MVRDLIQRLMAEAEVVVEQQRRLYCTGNQCGDGFDKEEAINAYLERRLTELGSITEYKSMIEARR